MYKKIRFYIRFASALFRKYYFFLIAGVILSVASFFILPHLIRVLPTFRFTKKIAVIGRYTLTDLPVEITQKISLGLTTVDPSGKPGSGVAQSWEVSPDGKTITFSLSPNFRWQDNTQLNSQDVKYQFRDAVIEYPDSSHLVFRLKDPFAPLPTLLAKPIIHYENSKLFQNSRVVGLGSYRMSDYKANGSVLESLSLSPQQADSKLPILSYYFYASPAQARTAFKLGLVDEVSNLTDLSELSNWPGTSQISLPGKDRYVALFFNTQSPNLTGQAGRNLRLAISYAVDKSRWPHRAVGPIEPGNWAFNPETKKYDLDLKRAGELLKKVEKIPEKLIINTVPAYITVAESIKSDLSQLNLATEVVVVQDIPRDFDMLLVAQATPLDPDQYNFWHSTQEATNLTGLNNPRIDKLLEDGRRVYDFEERKKIYQDFQKYLVEEAPAVFLFYPELYTISRK